MADLLIAHLILQRNPVILLRLLLIFITGVKCAAPLGPLWFRLLLLGRLFDLLLLHLGAATSSLFLHLFHYQLFSFFLRQTGEALLLLILGSLIILLSLTLHLIVFVHVLWLLLG